MADGNFKLKSSLLNSSRADEVTLRLGRDLVRSLKRGDPWVYADALREVPQAPPGTRAVLLDNKRGRPVARGFYECDSPLAFRACNVDDEQPLNESWARSRLYQSLELRKRLFENPSAAVGSTTGYRLFNGEGDGLPGLVADVYDSAAVVKLDGPGAAGFWNAAGIADWLSEELRLETICERPRERGADARMLKGTAPEKPIEFLENGTRFTVDILHGQKTGFFLDQRDNRLRVRQIANGLRVLNLFGYTGGFSIAAGCGGARHVTTVDLAEPAVLAANSHWLLNGLTDSAHAGVTADAFEFLAAARQNRETWDLVISDPPSFAPSKAALSKAVPAYQKLASESAAVTARGGLLALSSCSSHIDQTEFLRISEEGISQARRRGTVLGIHGQPADHPTPLALPEFRYLKFVLFQVH